MNKYKIFTARVIFPMAFILLIILMIKGCFNGEKHIDLEPSVSNFCGTSMKYSSISDFCNDFRLDLKKNEFKTLKELTYRVTEWIDKLEDSEDEILDGMMEELHDIDGPDDDYYF